MLHTKHYSSHRGVRAEAFQNIHTKIYSSLFDLVIQYTETV